MNITVSLDELRDHEANLANWHLKRNQTFCMALLTYRTGLDFSDTTGNREKLKQYADARAAEWEKSTPHPKLIPAV